MKDLESYLINELPKEERMSADLDAGILDAIRVLLDGTFDPKKLWPYSISTDGQDDYGEKPPSRSTAAMILAALQNLDSATTVKLRASSGYPILTNLSKQGTTLKGWMEDNQQTKIQKAAKELINVVKKDSKDANFLTSSPTYGKDDILSLGWLVEVAQQQEDNELLKIIGEKVAKRIEKVTNGKDGLSTLAQKVLDSEENSDKKRVVGDSSYVLIRFVRLIKAVAHESLTNTTTVKKDDIDPALHILFQRFETRLHDQLSFWEIPDSRYDPAELAFCLEGMLLTRRHSIDERLFDRVMSVLRKTQERVAYWRTETPMITEHTGKVLFPVSVETANSILASFALFDDGGKPYDAKASTYIGLITRYWTWLKARQATVGTFRGWHSEHINNPNLIHTWETSQVLEFLVAFRDQLRRHMARQSLILSNLKLDWPKLRDMGINGKACDDNVWHEITKKSEPVTVLGADYQTYRKVGEHFYDPRFKDDNSQPNWSMLLYGPPGTGKSTLGKFLAAAMDVPFITVTVSDFLGGGEAEVEHRAKMVFKVLELQPLSVVLFDEMDQFMLDRDSPRYGNQDTVFQFLTPGMLTKFADLHDAETVIFIVATNYEDRIDAAIKRPGRIDRQYLMLPFDGDARLRILTGFSGELEAMFAAKDGGKERIKAASLFLGWGDLKRVAGSRMGDIDKLEGELDKASRTTRLAAYANRFRNPGGERDNDKNRDPIEFDLGPVMEFGALLRLANEYWKDLGGHNIAKIDVETTLLKLEINKNGDIKKSFKKALKPTGLSFPTKLFS